MVIRWIAALVAFLIIAGVGVALAGGIPEAGEADPVTFAFQAVANVLALILGVALLGAIVVYLIAERIQTGSNASLTQRIGDDTNWISANTVPATMHRLPSATITYFMRSPNDSTSV